MAGKNGAGETQFSCGQEAMARIEGAADCGMRAVSIAELRELVGARSDWIWETDSELRFSWLSGNYEEITGISPAKVLGHFRFDFLKKASKGSDSAAAHLADLEARQPFRDFVYELDGGRPDCRWVATSGYPRFDETGAFLGYRGVGRNVTGVAAAFETLKSAENQSSGAAESQNEQASSDLARTLDSMKMGIVLVNADLRVEIVNHAFYDIWRLTREEAGVGSPFRALMDINRHNGIYDVSDAKWENYVASRLNEIRAGDVAQREFRRADGRTVIYSVTALSGGKRLISYYDVTEMKDREARLAVALERSKLADAVINGVKDPIFVKDSDLNFVFANEAFAKLFGVKPEEMLGKKGGDFVPPEDAALFERSEREVLETGQFYETEENFEFAGIDRSRIVRKNKVKTDSGKDYVACFIFDITDMKRREMEADEARQRLANVLESLPAGVIIYDGDDKFVLANKKLQLSLPALQPVWEAGCTFREAIEYGHSVGYFRSSGDRALDALYDTDLNAWLDRYMQRHQIRHAVYERQNPDGRWYQVYDTRTDDGTFIGVRVDITELKDREKALRDSMRQIDLYRHVLDELPVATNIKGEDLRLEYVNKTWCAFTGIPKEQAVGKTDMELFGVAEAKGFTAADAAVGVSGEHLETEEAVTHRDGTVRQLMTRKGHLVAIDGSVHLFGSSTDITDIKLREYQLKESLRENELFRNLIDNVPVAIYAKRPDLKLFYVNKGWCDLTGFSKEQAIGKTDGEIFGEYGKAFMEGDLAVLRTRENQEIEEAATVFDGSMRHQIARKSVMAASDGSLYLIGSTTDITELKLRERELREAQQRAVLADRAKSEFLANMSHEIRTPMNGVLGMAELLAKSELDAKQKTFTDIIVKSGNALLTIINDILDFSKIDAGQLVLDPAPFNLAEAIEDVATLVSTRAKEKDLELIVRVEPKLTDLYIGDVGRIRQIITNLLGNAVKFTDSGHVLVDAAGDKRADCTKLTISVTDTGMGIPENKLKQVFEKFSQVDASSTRRHEGTGLGLAITSRLVALMGGEIGVDSAEGKGSTFWFTVELPHAGTRSTRRVTPLDVSGARILIIDDNAVNRSILTEQMVSWTFDSCAAENGLEGLGVLKAAASYGVPVDCVVLDYQMPLMSGAEVARIIRATPEIAGTPIVMLTSVDQSLSNIGYRDLSMDAQLIKPARSSVLLEALVSTIQKHRSTVSRAEHHGEVEKSASRETAAAQNRVSAAAMSLVRRTAPSMQQKSRMAPADDHRLDILVAEDNEVNQLVFTQILGETRYSFEIVSNGRRAVEAFGKMSPRMILMDVSMPEMNGLEATGAIRRLEEAAGTRVPIIGVTAHALKGDRERCIEAGMDDYLPKPISPKALMEKIERWAYTQVQGQRNAG
jgi:PAS domain S-box-containing protein